MDRFKYLIQIIGYSAIVAIFTWYFSSSFLNGYDLSVNGKVAIAKVVDFEYEETRGRKGRVNKYFRHKIIYNTYDRWIDLGKEHPISSKFYVVYSSKNPHNIFLGNEKPSAFEYLENDISWLVLRIGPVFLLLALYLVFDSLKKFINPPIKEKASTTVTGRQEKSQPKILSAHQEKQEIIKSKKRLSSPLIKSFLAFLITFISICIFVDEPNGLLQLVQTSLLISLIVFIFVYLSFYKPKDTV